MTSSAGSGGETQTTAGGGGEPQLPDLSGQLNFDPSEIVDGDSQGGPEALDVSPAHRRARDAHLMRAADIRGEYRELKWFGHLFC